MIGQGKVSGKYFFEKSEKSGKIKIGAQDVRFSG